MHEGVTEQQQASAVEFVTGTGQVVGTGLILALIVIALLGKKKR